MMQYFSPLTNQTFFKSFAKGKIDKEFPVRTSWHKWFIYCGKISRESDEYQWYFIRIKLITEKGHN